MRLAGFQQLRLALDIVLTHVYGEPGDLICKPRGQWHAFWNGWPASRG
jgi:hypothetical protein